MVQQADRHSYLLKHMLWLLVQGQHALSFNLILGSVMRLHPSLLTVHFFLNFRMKMLVFKNFFILQSIYILGT